jgi:cell division protein FtsQ
MSDDAVPAMGRWRRLSRRVVRLSALAMVLTAPWWAQHLEYFRVRRVEITGTRYVPPAAILSALALDSATSLWARTGPLATRVRAHPQVRDAVIRRKLPGTLVIAVTENLPIALVESPEGVIVVDRDARPLPIDPSQTPLDLPLVARRDSAALHLLGDLLLLDPGLFARVSELRWDADGGMRVILAGVVVRTDPRVSAERFAEIVLVEADLLRRGQRVRELDLRYRDQIVARIE